MPSRLRPLWKCPKCGARFVNRNNSHSCVKVPLAAHFAGKDPGLPALFRAYKAFVRKCGPFTVIPQQTRIVLLARVRFAVCVVRKRHLECGFWVRRPITDERLRRIYPEFKHIYYYVFNLTDPGQLDASLLEYYRESYRDAGMQEGLTEGKRAAYVRRRKAR